LELLNACGDLDLHRTVDTSGHADMQTILKVAARTELFLYDLKHMDPEKHCKYTGVSNEIILNNLKRLSQDGARIIIRLPLIPGLNSDDENIDRTGTFLSSLEGVRQVNILPYHSSAKAKYKNFAMKNNAADVRQPSEELVESIVRRLKSYNLHVDIGG
jgi:pyruvate formate lyase activating enzyme